MVKRMAGGDVAEPGFYWSRRTWEIVPVGDEGRRLEGGPADRYLRLPAPLALAVAPLMGAAFAMFLPLVGFVMVFRELVARVARFVRRRPRAGDGGVAAGP